MPRGTKRVEAAIETRTRIMLAAQLTFRQKGYSEVSLRDLAAVAGLSTGAIFAHFDGKGALYEAAVGQRAPIGALADASADMYDALTKALDLLQANFEPPTSVWKYADEVIPHCREALAKARGTQ